MALKDLRDKYRKSNKPAAINAAIRAELPGGNEVLDGLERCHKIVRALPRGSEAHQSTEAAYDSLVRVANAMEDEIRRRYDMPPAD